MTNKNGDFEVIELSMLDKRKFFPLSGLGSFTVHSILYPLVLLRIRLQLQEGARLYTGLAHATACILREEGFRGLYSGYFVKSAQIISSVFYASTYETVRHMALGIPELSQTQRSFIGGGVASMLLQTVLVPIDVISQHLMVLSRASTLSSTSASTQASIAPSVKFAAKSSSSVMSQVHLDQVRALSPIRLSSAELSTSWARFRAVLSYVNRKHGLRGFYNGYIISLCTFVPSSAMWWAFYDKFCRLIAASATDLRRRFYSGTASEGASNTPVLPRLAIQLCAAPLAGIASATIVNPVDCIRVRMQVGHLSFRETLRILWATEGTGWFAKGLSARLLQTSVFSFWLILIYEPVKLFCLKSEYRDRFRSSYDEW